MDILATIQFPKLEKVIFTSKYEIHRWYNEIIGQNDSLSQGCLIPLFDMCVRAFMTRGPHPEPKARPPLEICLCPKIRDWYVWQTACPKGIQRVADALALRFPENASRGSRVTLEVLGRDGNLEQTVHSYYSKAI